MPTLHVILGPTGVGKTELSLRLAEQFDCPIVSADSRQIYRALPIGTAAPTAEELARVQHHFIACKDLTETYNAGQYARDCKVLLRELFLTHDCVVMVGGSMMYIDAVCNGLDHMPDVPDSVREQVRQAYHHNGLEWLQTEVQHLDPLYWEQVDQHNPQRLMHCLEICYVSQQPYSNFRQQGATASERTFDVDYHVVARPREELYQRINLRVHQMIEAGLLHEAQCAFQQLGISLQPCAEGEQDRLPNSINTVGYKELLPYFRGEYTLERAIELIQQNSRHYAKRQMTWWRSKGFNF